MYDFGKGQEFGLGRFAFLTVMVSYLHPELYELVTVHGESCVRLLVPDLSYDEKRDLARYAEAVEAGYLFDTGDTWENEFGEGGLVQVWITRLIPFGADAPQEWPNPQDVIVDY